MTLLNMNINVDRQYIYTEKSLSFLLLCNIQNDDNTQTTMTTTLFVVCCLLFGMRFSLCFALQHKQMMGGGNTNLILSNNNDDNHQHIQTTLIELRC